MMKGSISYNRKSFKKNLVLDVGLGEVTRFAPRPRPFHIFSLFSNRGPVSVFLSITVRSALSIPLEEAISFLNISNPLQWREIREELGASITSMAHCPPVYNLL